MNFFNSLSPSLIGTTIAAAMVTVQVAPVSAMSGSEINDIAREVTVLIRGKQGHGSGVLISKNGTTYYVLTAAHVVASPDDYAIVTYDKKVYPLNYAKVRRFASVDLAILEFTSDSSYSLAKLADSDRIQEGMPVFVSGWPRLTAVGNAAGGQLTRQFTNGQISGILPQPLEGYELIYTNTTLGGMSGGPVLDAGGRVVGIHGLGDTEDPTSLQREGISEEAATSIAGLIKPGFNYAIPINTFLAQAPQEKIFLSLSVEPSAPPELGSPYVASSQPDPRDTMNVSEVFSNINQGVNTIRNIRGLFGF
jgi:S1-C subfamily serine protease